MKEGFTIDDFKTVHRKKYDEWGDDDKMVKYLRPETLYSNKFEGYLNQKETKSTEFKISSAGAFSVYPRMKIPPALLLTFPVT